MFGHRTLHRHAAMMNRMAEVQGIDLTAAMSAARMSGEDWREAVLRCSGCANPEGCLSWLGAHDVPAAGAEPTAPMPEFCVNGALLERLRAPVTTEVA